MSFSMPVTTLPPTTARGRASGLLPGSTAAPAVRAPGIKHDIVPRLRAALNAPKPTPPQRAAMKANTNRYTETERRLVEQVQSVYGPQADRIFAAVTVARSNPKGASGFLMAELAKAAGLDRGNKGANRGGSFSVQPALLALATQPLEGIGLGAGL